MTDQRSPDFFIVGHHKSGTTALYEMLRRHSQIFMPELKEPRFLASELSASPDEERRSVHPRTLAEYLQLFAAAGPQQRIGEASATYLRSPTAAAAIAELEPDARIIAILREPTSFLRSLHLTYLRIGFEDQRDLRRAIALEEPRRRGERIPVRCHLPALLQYSEQVRYVEQLRRYHERFSSDRVLVLIYDDFKRDNAATLRTVLRFLEVDEREIPPEVEANVTQSSVRSPRVGEMLRSLSLGRGGIARPLRTATKALTSQRMRRSAMRTLQRRVVVGEPPPPDPTLMLELRRRFAPEVDAIGEYLGRDLVSLWGYDRLGR
jgi:hypothetical protein